MISYYLNLQCIEYIRKNGNKKLIENLTQKIHNQISTKNTPTTHMNIHVYTVTLSSYILHLTSYYIFKNSILIYNNINSHQR